MSVSFIKVTSNNLFKSADRLENRSKQSNTIAKSVGKTLQQQSVFKKQSIARRESIYQKRRDGVRRKQQRDLFEASKSTGSIRSVGRAVTNSTKGFLGRILDAIAITMVGWAVINLPTIISLSKQLGERIVKISGTMSGFMSNTLSIFREIGTLSSAFIRNLIAFDFSDMGKQVDASLSKVRTTFNRMELDFFNAINILVQPFDFGEEDEEQTPPSQQQPPSQQPPSGQPRPPSGPTGVAYGVNLKALADATSKAEGNYTSVGPTTYLGHGMGRYQFMTGRNDTQQILLKNAGNNKAQVQALINRSLRGDRSAALQLIKYFPPKDQDALFATHAQNTLTQIKRKYPNADEFFLVQKFGVYHLTGGDYPNSRDVNGTSGKAHGDKILSAYKGLKGRTPTTPTAPPAQTTPAPPATPGGLGSRPLVSGDVLTQSIGRGVPYIQITDTFKDPDRPGHLGLDIACPSGTWIALRVDCEWVGYRWDDGGYGHVVDVWVPSYGIQLRLSHLLAKPRAFTTMKAGKSFAQVGSSGRSSGPHIHFEYTTQKGKMGYGSDGDPSPYVPLLLLTNKPNTAAFNVPGKSTPAQVTSSRRATTVSDAITPESKGKTLVVAAPQQQMYQNPAMMVGASGGSPIIVSGPSLNSLIKQRILLELAYT